MTSTEWTPLPDGPLHAAVVGPPGAPTVVGVPGLACSHHYFLPLARELAPEVRTAVLDLPGFGRSPGPPHALDVPGLARALAAWLRVTGRSGSLLVANSVGCAVVLELAVQAPELMGPVVLAGPAIDPTSSRPLGPALRLLSDARREARLVPRLLHDWLVVAGLPRVLATYRYALDHRIEAAAALVPGPAVVVAGEHDPIAPREWAARLAGVLPRGRLVELPGQAHGITATAPEVLARIVRAELGLPPVAARPPSRNELA